jgi:hypothetical protein
MADLCPTIDHIRASFAETSKADWTACNQSQLNAWERTRLRNGWLTK